jgi:hypothetical protein
MSTDETDRTSVRTYIPQYQKEQWKSHADELDMSQSEFVRTMVQAGRSGFDPDTSSNPEKTNVSGSNPRGNDLEDRILDILDSGDHYDWDELLSALTGDIEERLEKALQDLQSEGRVQYSGRNGGYVIDE